MQYDFARDDQRDSDHHQQCGNNDKKKRNDLLQQKSSCFNIVMRVVERCDKSVKPIRGKI
jgi:hypothetical protein